MLKLYLVTAASATTSNAAGWSLINAPSATSNELSNVACASSNDCWAMGSTFLHWDGISWTSVATPSVNAGAITSLACASSSECWGVGYTVSGNVYQTLIERWDGNSWFVVASPTATSTRGSQLTSVTCTSTADCWAVGYNIGTGAASQSLVERWNGSSWAIVPSQDHFIRGVDIATFLYGVACAAASDCWAVGGWDDGESGDNVFEHWDGTSWSIFSTPSTGYSFTSVTCPSTTDCWAVTPAGDGQYGLPHSAHWNGTTWTIVSMPVVSGPGGSVQTVSCASSSQCFAVGSQNNGTSDKTLIEQWDGNSWSIVPSPNNGTLPQYLFGVACASTSECWAVGYYSSGTGHLPLIEEFSPTVPPLTGIVSRMSHGSAGTFDIDLPLTGRPGIECRTGSPSGSYKLVFSFVNNVSNCGAASIGSVNSGPEANQCTVNVSNVADQQYLTVTLNNVIDSQSNSGNLAAIMGVLIGDVDASGRVDAGDVSSARQQTLQTITTSNFRNDLNASGRIDAADVSLARQDTLHSLPSTP